MASRSDDGGQSRPLIAWFFALVLVAGGAVCIWLVPDKTNVRPNRTACPVLRKTDDLVHLASRSTKAEATAQLDRWSDCDATMVARARDTLVPYDAELIGTLAIVLLTAALVMRRQRRWRLASAAGMLLVLAYVVADSVEDFLLDRFLRAGDWSTLLPASSAVKFGALVGALPLAGGALFVLLFREPPLDLAKNAPPRTYRFFERWSRRRADRHWPTPVGVDMPGDPRQPPEAAAGMRRGRLWTAVVCLACRLGRWLCGAACDPPAAGPVRPQAASVTPPGLGICCSGGGIRSAAFSLGALQALDEPHGAKAETELSRARWLFSVSGGSYITAAWVTARAAAAGAGAGTGASAPAREPWSRRSFEEQYLRRHASYLAPGLAGKAWALVWFLLAFAANAALVVLTIGAVFLPIGWAIHTGVDRQPVDSGVVSLLGGGCIQLADGSFLAAVPGTTLRLSGGSKVFVTRGIVVDPPKEKVKSKVAVTAEGPPPLVALAIVGDQTTSSTTQPGPGLSAGSVSCPALPGPAEVSDGLPGDAPGRLFEKGTKVPILADPRVGVHSSDRVTGCVDWTQTLSCTTAAAGQHVVGTGSRLLTAPAVQLTLATSAIVSEGGVHRLYQACDAGPCARFRLHPWLTWVPLGSLVLLAVLGVALVTMREDPDARRNVQAWTKRLTLLVALIVVALWALPNLVLFLGRGRSLLEQQAGLVTGASGGTILLALLSQLGAASGKSTTPTGRAQELLKAAGRRLRPLLLRIATLLAGPVLLIFVAAAFAARGASLNFHYGEITTALAIIGWLVIFGSCGDLNRWSLHPYYRERLSCAFAFDSVLGKPSDPNLADLPQGPDDLQLTLCATANLADDRVTPPGRPALPWTFSAREMGTSPGTGYYAPGDLPERFQDLGKVWTSVAVSGAAFSPAMGKMSRPERFLFALGNLRLGIWYPNPLYFQPGKIPLFDLSWYEWHHPRPWYLFKEALGLHKLGDPWVYVTDGGHYENLGLVELLRRKKCPEIYCFDAAGDSTSTFGTFADAMRLAREEHEIEIELDPRAMGSDPDGVSKVGVWAGTVKYPDAPTGWLVVAKLAVPLSAPFDIIDLARTLPSFPTNPTADQLYTDQKFEAYRALGEHLGREAVALGNKIRDLLAHCHSVEQAVAKVNKELCGSTDPHPCPPPKAGSAGEKKAEAKDAKKSG